MKKAVTANDEFERLRTLVYAATDDKKLREQILRQAVDFSSAFYNQVTGQQSKA